MGNDMMSHAASLPDILESFGSVAGSIPLSDPYDVIKPVDVQPARGDEPGADNAKVVSILPYARNILNDLTQFLIIPAREETSGLDKIGFSIEKRVRVGNSEPSSYYVLGKDGARQLIDLYNRIHLKLKSLGIEVKEYSEGINFHMTIASKTLAKREWSLVEYKKACEELKCLYLKSGFVFKCLELWYPDLREDKRLVERFELTKK